MRRAGCEALCAVRGAASGAEACKPNRGRPGDRRSRAVTWGKTVLEPPERKAPPPAAEERPSVAAALAHRPVLSLLQEAACALAAGSLCWALHASSALLSIGALAVLFLALVVLSREWLLERQYKAVQRSERELAGPYSHFLQVDGIAVHFTRRLPAEPAPSASGAAAAAATADDTGDPPPQPACVVHCVHGLGANTNSWALVDADLVAQLGAAVTAHDILGFGLTQRSSSVDHYSLGFNEAAIQAILAATDAGPAPGEGAGADATVPAPAPANHVLIGHSFGGAVVAETVINRPQGVAALVLVAPAVLAWRHSKAPAHASSRGLGRALSLWSWGQRVPQLSTQQLAATLTRALTASPFQFQALPGSMGKDVPKPISVRTLARALTRRPTGQAADSPEVAHARRRVMARGLSQMLGMAMGASGGEDPLDESMETLTSGLEWTESGAYDGRESQGLGPAAAACPSSGVPRKEDEAAAAAALEEEGQGEAEEVEDGEGEVEEWDITKLPSRRELLEKQHSLGLGGAAAAAAGWASYRNEVQTTRVPNPGPAGRGLPGAPQQLQQQQQHRQLLHTVVALWQGSMVVVGRALLRALRPLLVLALRRMVRCRSFWEQGLTAAVAEAGAVTPAMVDGYRFCQLARGWESGILRFAEARLAEKRGLFDALRFALHLGSSPSQAERLAQVVAQHGIPVLVLHGRDDLIVPPANSRRLAQQLPGARYVEFEGCGHLPQEEQPGRFVEVVTNFLTAAGVVSKEAEASCC